MVSADEHLLIIPEGLRTCGHGQGNCNCSELMRGIGRKPIEKLLHEGR